jgi:hypothetical protein
MIQLILHGIGDYFIQNDWMALNKKNKGLWGFLACLIHCITYSLPFLFIGSLEAVAAIFITHFIIDRTNLVSYLLAVKNNVKHPANLGGGYDTSNFGFGVSRPAFITIWLNIITDNILHIICNYIALKYL